MVLTKQLNPTIMSKIKSEFNTPNWVYGTSFLVTIVIITIICYIFDIRL